MNGGVSSFGRLHPRSQDLLGLDVLTELTQTGDSSASPKMLPTYLADLAEGVWEIAVVLEKRPGLLPRVQATIEQQGLTSTSVQAFAAPGAPRTSLRCLVRPLGSTSKEAVLSAVLATPGVIDASIEEDQGKIFVASGFPLVGLNGVRLTTFTATHLSGLCGDLQDVLGSGGSFLLYKQGLLLGERTWADYLERVGRPYALQEWAYVLRLYETMGWGRVELVSVHHLAGVAEVRVRDNFECLGRCADHPICQLFRGHLAGAFSALWQRPVDCIEEKCTAEGHPSCTYLIAIRAPSAEGPCLRGEALVRDSVVRLVPDEGSSGTIDSSTQGSEE